MLISPVITMIVSSRDKHMLRSLILYVTLFHYPIWSSSVSSNKRLEEHSRTKRFLIEPIGTQMGLFGTISIPLEYEKQVSVAYFFEGNYYTLQNASWVRPAFESTIVDGRRIERELHPDLEFNKLDRKFAYFALEKNIELQGLPGRACLLRAICEHASVPLHHNGVFGDVLYIIFTPSSSLNEDLPDDFYVAEHRGRRGKCKKYIDACPSSIINTISFIPPPD